MKMIMMRMIQDKGMKIKQINNDDDDDDDTG